MSVEVLPSPKFHLMESVAAKGALKFWNATSKGLLATALQVK
jgi:hypothetical protein